MSISAFSNRMTLVVLVLSSLFLAKQALADENFKGQVLGGGAPIAKSTVTLWQASAGAPKQLAQTKTDDNGRFEIRSKEADSGSILYLIAAGGEAKSKPGSTDNPAIVLLSVLGNRAPDKVVVNELTTVASAFTAARFINGESISGNPLGLRIAAGNAPHLVDPVTGGWGKVLVDPFNSTYTTTLVNLDTLGSLITASFTVADDNWRARFFKAATPLEGPAPKTTLEAISNIARRPWVEAKTLYQLFDGAYPEAKEGGRRAAPFVPYLMYAPDDFVLSLWFGGGGSYSNGNFVFDAEGNVWSGQNWMAGSQSGVIKNIGGGVIKFSPNGTPLSPPITGFTGMGTDGFGWGTGVTQDGVWASSWNGKVLVMDFDGHPIAKESDFPIKEKLHGLMGVGIAANGDVWIAAGSDDLLLYFPGGRFKDGRTVKVKGLKSPFGVAIDAQNRVWVSNSQSDTVLRFPADDPSTVETFRAGISVRGVALDSKGNLWVASLLSPDFRIPRIPEGITIMQQFKLLAEAMQPYSALDSKKTTGVVNLIRPDGSQQVPEGYRANGLINGPWGMAIDGNDDVWVANGLGRSVILLAGAEPKGYPAGTKPGDLVHNFRIGSVQIVTMGAVDPAGNVWVANNWNSYDVAGGLGDPPRRISTWGGGSGFTVIYGVAAPVKTPLMGQVSQP